MKIRKRVKIGLPPQQATDDGINAKKLSKASLNLLDDHQDDDEDNVEVPLGTFKRKGKAVEAIESLQQESTSYGDIFSKKPVSRVMNLEDMAEEDDDDSLSYPSKKEIEELKSNKLKAQATQKKKDAISEKVYVSLLDDDDKLEIMESIKKNGGTENTPSDPDIDMLDEERLPLSSRESLLHKERLKQTIEEALKSQDDESSNAWESQLLSKGSGQSQQAIDIPKLPKLHPSESEDNVNDSDPLAQTIESVSFRKTQLMKQLTTLQAQKATLKTQQDALTHQFNRLQQEIH